MLKTKKSMKTIRIEVLDDKVDADTGNEYQQVSIQLSRWLMGGGYKDPSGSHGKRATTLDWVDKVRAKHKMTRGEAVLALLAEHAPAPNYRKSNKPRPGEPEIPSTASDVDWPATEEELRERN